jgi:sec-independent protein translocase protein TatA
MGFSLPHLIVVLVVVLLLFGTKRLRHIGSDLGAAVKGFKKAMHETDKALEQPPEKLSPKDVHP